MVVLQSLTAMWVLGSKLKSRMFENALPMEPSSQLTDQIFDAFNFYPQSYFAHSFCKSQQIYAWHRGLFNHGDMNFHTYGTLSAK